MKPEYVELFRAAKNTVENISDVDNTSLQQLKSALFAIEKLGYSAEICHDELSSNPLEFSDWSHISFSVRHYNYMDPKEAFKKYDDALKAGRAFVLGYYEHSEIQWALAGEEAQCPWDSVSCAGILVYDGPEDPPPSKETARAFLEEYNNWCNGYVYCCTIYDVCDNIVDSCGGFYYKEDIELWFKELNIIPSRFFGNADFIMT